MKKIEYNLTGYDFAAFAVDENDFIYEELNNNTAKVRDILGIICNYLSPSFAGRMFEMHYFRGKNNDGLLIIFSNTTPKAKQVEVLNCTIELYHKHPDFWEKIDINEESLKDTEVVLDDDSDDCDAFDCDDDDDDGDDDEDEDEAENHNDFGGTLKDTWYAVPLFSDLTKTSFLIGNIYEKDNRIYLNTSDVRAEEFYTKVKYPGEGDFICSTEKLKEIFAAK